ncbi:hypothetical protein BDW74DRAFT_177622 [Aspergillus multicolor]|uniref:uncharacterized protein n=1 Tax=Aspergillus multicolor TaxID=41759 RepID=UPI003CCD8724
MAHFADLEATGLEDLAPQHHLALSALTVQPEIPMSAVDTLLAPLDATAPFLSNFRSPPIQSRPYVRWWWPHGAVDNEEIRAEVIQISEAGFGGIEIQDVHHSTPEGTEWHHDTHGWASEPGLSVVIVALDEANSRDSGHDLTFDPCWPMGVPFIVPDDEAAAKELVLGKAYIYGSEVYNGSVPSPFSSPKDGVEKQELDAVQAWRLDDQSDADSNPAKLVYRSMIDLTDEVVDGQVVFIPPDNGTWLIYSATIRGTGQRPEDFPHTVPPSYMVDHFSTAGAQAVIDFWESSILTPELLAKLTEIPTALFEDSLEMNSDPLYEFADQDIHASALHDYRQALSDLFDEYHIQPLKNWLHSHNLQYRGQPYGVPGMDSMRLATTLDIPEGESLGFTVLNDFRVLAGALSLSGNNELSTELATVNPEFAAGVTRNVLHGFSHIDGPEASWPGWAVFTPYRARIGYSESWGPRIPTWMHASDFTGYMGRVSYFTGFGTPKYDVAFYRQNGAADAHGNRSFFADEGMGEGWSTAFVNEFLLDLPGVDVKRGRLAPDTADFVLLVVQGDPNSDSRAALTESSAKRLLQFAEDGLPILMLGDWSEPRSLGLESDTTIVASAVKAMLELDNVANVGTSTDNIRAGLGSSDVSPAVQYSAPSLLHIRREYKEYDLYFFSADTDSADTTVYLPLRHRNVVPIELDAWTGDALVSPLYKISNNQLQIPIVLNPGQSKLLIIAPSQYRVDHALATTADRVVRDPNTNKLLVRATKGGTYTTTTDTRKRTTTLEDAFATIELTSWNLQLDDWQPAGTSNGNSSADITATTLVRHDVNLTSLAPWPSIAGIEDVSGNATYTATFTLGTAKTSYSSKAMGAYLTFTKFNGSFRVSVNGESLPPLDQMGVQFDISRWLKNGTNTLEVEVASTLMNRMRIVYPDVYGSYKRQEFGLRGVSLVPFSQACLT